MLNDSIFLQHLYVGGAVFLRFCLNVFHFYGVCLIRYKVTEFFPYAQENKKKRTKKSRGHASGFALQDGLEPTTP